MNNENQIARYLTDGYWNDNGGSRRKFDVPANGELTVNITGLTPEGKQLARWALDAWEDVTPITFREVSHNNADIMFDDIDGLLDEKGNELGAWARSTGFGEFIDKSVINIPTDWINTYGTGRDSYSYSTYLHEIGHALGLGHPGPYNGGYPQFGTDNIFPEDSWQMSVLSYFTQVSNKSIAASYAHPVTPMMADIIAIQDLYGKPDSANAGDTVYGVNSNLKGHRGDFHATWTGQDNPFHGLDMRGQSKPEFVDLDGDGDLDMTTLDTSWEYGDRIHIYKNVDGNFNWFAVRDFPHTKYWPVLDYEFVHLYGGTPDLVTLDKIYVIPWNKTKDTFPHKGKLSDADIEFADINGDGKLDWIYIDPHGIGYMLNTGTLTQPVFYPKEGISFKSDIFSIMKAYQFVDIDNDDDLDVVLVDVHGKIYIVENTGTPTSLEFDKVPDEHINPLDAATYGDGPVHTIQDFAFADLNGDGDVDMFSLDENGNIYYFKNDGTGDGFHFDPTSFNRQVTFTLYDTDGTDTLDLSTDVHDQVIRLGIGEASDVYGLVGNLVIGPDTVIERVKAGAGNDTVHGNPANNELFGRSGNDTLYGHEGTDRLHGGPGNDMLDGGQHRDILRGGQGDDVLIGGPGKDAFVIFPENAGSTDTILDFSRGNDRIWLYQFDDMTFADISLVSRDDSLVIDLDKWGGGAVILDGYSGNLDASDFVIL